MDQTAASRVRLKQADIHEQWEGEYLNTHMDRFYDLAFDRIVHALGNPEGKRVLDVGCGYCHHTRRLAERGLTITAVDFSSVALDHARENLSKAGIADKVTLQQADATALPFGDSSFDHVLMWGVLMHVPQAERALSELGRVLKPGGKLVLSETNARSLEVKFFEPAIEVLRRLLGRDARRRQRTSLGIEEWQGAEQGGLLVRKTDMHALEGYCRTIGLRLSERIAGEFTQIYTRLPGTALKRIVYAFNRAYFRHGSPGPALGNILILQKE